MKFPIHFDDVEIDGQYQRRRTGGYFGGAGAKVR